jgi:hypothetical protein
MLAPRHAAALRRGRLWGLLWLAVSALMLAAIIRTVVAWPSISMVVGAILTTLAPFCICIWAIPAVLARPETIYMFFDRDAPRVDAQPDSEERQRLRHHLTLHWGEVDARLTELGLDPLDRYLELRLDMGIARHDPEQAQRNITSLLEHPGTTLDDTTRRALEMVVSELAEAARHGARFCFWPLGFYTGLIQTNLKLYIR